MKLVFEMKKLGIRNEYLIWGKLQLLEENNALGVKGKLHSTSYRRCGWYQ
jgi:hypothetical protein